MKRKLWKFWAGRNWSKKAFELHYVPDQIWGVLYAGVTIFGYSVIYSDHW